MKKILLSAAVLAATIGSALAADLPSRKAPPAFVPPPPPPLWTGLYVGLNAGYGWGTSTDAGTVSAPIFDSLSVGPLAGFPAGFGTPFGWAALANTGIANVNQSGFVGGGQVGYNYQWGSNFVVGLEADLGGSAIRGSGSYAGASGAAESLFPGFTDTAVGGGVVNARIDWMGTVRGRLGYLFTPTLLTYVTGGLAYGGVHASAVHSVSATEYLGGAFNWNYNTISGAGVYSNTQVGWTIGGGLEWLFMPNWSVKAEALYYDLGNIRFASSPAGIFDANLLGTLGFPGTIAALHAPITQVKFDGVIARVGVNYHFNWGAPAPVVAKY